MIRNFNKKIFSFVFLILSDTVVVFFSFILAYLIRAHILPHIFSVYEKIPLYPLFYYMKHFYVMVIWICIFAYERLYTKRYSFWEEVKVILKSTTIASFFVMVTIFLTKSQVQFSRTIIVLMWFFSLILFPLFRYLTKTELFKLNIWKKNLIIIGANKASSLLIEGVKKNKTTGYEFVGIVVEDTKDIKPEFQGLSILGTLSELTDIIKIYNSKDIVITLPKVQRDELKKIIKELEYISESIWLVPRSEDLITTGVETEIIGQILTLNIKKNLEKPWNILIKLIFDKVLSLILLIVFFPLFLIISLAIRLESKGPVIYKQKRVGLGGKQFNFFKFRSMYRNNDDILYEYLKTNPRAKEEWTRYKKLKNYDPRVTRVGKILRKYSLDELPQIINVLLGDMSLVGPRPYLYEEIKGNHMFSNIIFRVKPGITGLWQISGRNRLLFDTRIVIDEHYIRNWSLWMDIIILMKSVTVVLSGKGAY